MEEQLIDKPYKCLTLPKAYSRLQRDGNSKQGTHVPELKGQALEIRVFEEAESCRTKFWKRESYTEMHRVNESSLNIKIYM